MIKIKRKIVLIFLNLKTKIVKYQTKRLMRVYNVNENDLLNCDFDLWEDLKKINFLKGK